MTNLIQLKGSDEGDCILKYIENRIIRSNKNVIGLLLGATGSGKSYTSLRIAELWYQQHFKKKFPVENVCFSVEEIISLLNKRKLKKGDTIIFEEAGVSMGALDFQTKISKIFTYVLQSFRNLNLVLILNLPYASMLNKNVRLLTHFQFEMSGIDSLNKISIVKPFFNQVNTRSGKCYPKYMRVKVGGSIRTIKRFKFSIPSSQLIRNYEEKKLNFVNNLISDVDKTIQVKNSKEIPKELTPHQKKIKELYDELKNQRLVAEKLGTTQGQISQALRLVKKKEIFNKNI